MIRFKDITKVYQGNVFALDNISVEIADGELVFLIGPSGAGKTTLLRLIIRDIIPTKGTLQIDDWDLNTIPTNKLYLLRRKVGMIFQDFKLLHDRTVYENIAIGAEILGKKPEEIEKDVGDILELVGLADKKNLFPLQLSAGEMQRTGIARAIISGPKILLADEPTGNLDPDTAWEILRILQEINKIGTTVIIATHNATIVNEMKKRTITLHNGKIKSDEENGRYHLGNRETKHSEKVHLNDKEITKHTKK